MSQATLEPPTASAASLDVDGWRALGQRIAATMAAAWGAETKPHYWDEVWEARAGKWPELDARREEIFALWRSEEEGDYTLGDGYCTALHDGWWDELKHLLREKRGSFPLHHFWEPGAAWTGRFTTLHLLLADGGTIPGDMTDAGEFRFSITRYRDVKLSLPEDAEFLLVSQGKVATWPGSNTARLRLAHESGGYRHYLGRRDVHCGHGLTLVLPGGRCIGGRYECNLTRSDCTPAFYFALAGGTEGTVRVIRPPEDAEFLLEGRAL